MKNRMRSARSLALVAVCLCVFVPPALAQSKEGTAPIDPAVFAEFDSKGEATFFVLFREKADLSPAFEIRDWGERGWFVYRRLVETAESSQAQVRTLLGAWGAEMRPFWIANAIEVRTKHRTLLSVLAARPEVAEIAAPPEVEPIPIEVLPGGKSPHSESIEWNIERIRAPEVWPTYGVRGEVIVIGSIDWGVQYGHPALVEQYRGNHGGGVFDHNYNWYDPAFLMAKRTR